MKGRPLHLDVPEPAIRRLCRLSTLASLLHSSSYSGCEHFSDTALIRVDSGPRSKRVHFQVLQSICSPTRAIKMRVTCSLAVLGLVATLAYADTPNGAKRDEAKRKIEACLKRNEVSSRQCKNVNKNLQTLIEVYWQGDKTVLPLLLRFTYMTNFLADALVSDPEGFLAVVSQLSEPERQNVASGIAGAVYGISQPRFEAVRTTLTRVSASSPNYEVARLCLLSLEVENAYLLAHYFPPQESGGPPANFVSWFSRDLYALEEKPLWPPSPESKQTYRVTVFPTFTVPKSVTLTLMPDGTGEVRFRATDRGRYHLATNTTLSISSQQVTDFANTLNRVRFWEQPTNATQAGYNFDGAEFILEGVRDGRYHIVVRWCPGNSAFGEAVRGLLRFGDSKFSGC